MGLSRNKVAVSEGAAGSPPFYGESENALRSRLVFLQRTQRKLRYRSQGRCSISRDHLWKYLNGGVAHLGERLNGIQEVVGSIPIVSTRR